MGASTFAENARMWITRVVHDERRDAALLAMAYVAISTASVAVGIWFLGWLYGPLGLVLILVAYFVCGGFQADEPVINAQSIRPRLIGVARMQNLAWWGPEQIRREMAFVLACLTAPVHLLVEAWLLLKRRKRLAELREDAAAELLAGIVAARGAVRIDSGSVVALRAVAELAELPGVVLLLNPDRVTVVGSVMSEIRNDS